MGARPCGEVLVAVPGQPCCNNSTDLMVSSQHEALPVSPLLVKPNHHVVTVVLEQKGALNETLY